MDALVFVRGAYLLPIQIAQASKLLEPRSVARRLKDVLEETRAYPARTLFGMSLGWLVLIGFYHLLGEFLTDSATRWIFNWSIEIGYGTGNFVPFYKCASVVSTIGFLVAGFATTRVRGGAPALFGFVASLELAVIISVIAVSFGPTRVPHTWFCAIWLALPTAHRIGLVLTPLAVTIGGLVGRRSRSYES
jgi:hypothetical protein